MLEERALTRVISYLEIGDVCSCRNVSQSWRESSDEADIWAGLAKLHYCEDLAASVTDKASFKSLVSSIHELLQMEKDQKQQSYISALHKLSRSERPLPSDSRTGAELLVELATHKRVIAFVRMDDGTEWTGELAPEKQDALFQRAIELLDILAIRNATAKKDLRQNVYESNGHLILPEVLSQHLLNYLPRMTALGPIGMAETEDGQQVGELVFSGFRTMDCRNMNPEDGSLEMLRATCSLFFHLFAKPEDVPGDLEKVCLNEADEATAAMELSGKWCTAMALQHQRVDGVPGNLDLTFEENGTVTGKGQDSWGEFSANGFWTKKLLFIRKVTPRGYHVDLFGFLQPDGSVRGTWLFNARTGGWWGWKGEPRDFTRGTHVHNNVA